VEVIAIAVDPPEVSARLAAGLGLSFAVASDEAHAAIDGFGVLDGENEVAWPAVYLIGPERRVQWRHIGDDYKPRPPIADVLRAIDETAAP
jgi:peroxiredoxin